PKSFANPEFLAKFKEFAAKLKNGEQPTPAEMKQFLPKEAQETIAGKLLDDMNKATGDNAGMSAAGLVSGKTAQTMDQTFMTSPEAQELSRAGKTLFDVATQRQLIEGDGSKLGRLPEGDRRELVEKALQIAGQPVTEANILAVNTIVQHESSWNPGITNNWDINAQRGIPSQGLMQTIPPTFNAHKDRSGQVEAAGHSNTIKDPLANLVAGIKYSEHRYGSLQNVPGVRSMAQGGGYKPY
ncbi:MAG TPA: transglycosylase SLT domain-containing protein, partial [Candidatus Obscuribacter sp.]|nr:transglycosylase SLT domain-containing protein [Candidatus Obscuribacter sp.]